MHHDEEHAVHVVPYATHIKVWVALIVLTAITIGVAQIHLGTWNDVVAFTVATLKAAFVLAFFMHLKYEGFLFKGMLAVAVVTLAVIFSLTFVDYSYRY